MGAACNKNFGDTLDDITSRLTGKIGQLHVTGRYHRLPTRINDMYDVHDETLGTGYTGSVVRASRTDGSPGEFAVKTLNVRKMDKEKKEEIRGEVEVALALDHPHIVRLVDVFEDSQDKVLYMVMEVMQGGELLVRIQEKKRLSEAEAGDFMRQMLRALNYLHMHGFVHRDIKPENFMFDTAGGSHLRLIDFGFAKHTKPGKDMKEALGTLAYAAPEVLNGCYDQQCDMWSVGVILYIMLAGTMPFYGSNASQTQAIKKGNYKMTSDVWNRISPEAKDLVQKLLVVDSKQRLTALQALHHPFVVRNTSKPRLSYNHVQVVEAFRKFSKSSEFQRAAMEMYAETLTNADRENLREVFLELDVDNSGTITIEELKRVMVDEQHMSDAEFRRTFDAMDFNGDGEIHYVDFVAAFSCLALPLDDQRLKETFTRFDVDRTGYITTQNLEDVIGPQLHGDVRSWLAEADTDGDKQISYPEFVMLVKTAPHGATGKAASVRNLAADNESEWSEDEGETSTCSIQ